MTRALRTGFSIVVALTVLLLPTTASAQRSSSFRISPTTVAQGGTIMLRGLCLEGEVSGTGLADIFLGGGLEGGKIGTVSLREEQSLFGKVYALDSSIALPPDVPTGSGQVLVDCGHGRITFGTDITIVQGEGFDTDDETPVGGVETGAGGTVDKGVPVQSLVLVAGAGAALIVAVARRRPA